MSNTVFSLNGKVAIVTGGSMGLGEAIALEFAKAGADVVVTSRGVPDDKLLKAVSDKITKLGRRSLAIHTDVTQRASVDSLIQRVAKEFGSIDIWVNSAGYLVMYPFLETSEKEWDETMITNVKGTFNCCQAVAKKMVEQKKGIIINLSSMWARKAIPGASAYCASKAAIVSLTEVMSIELAKYGIRVNSIAPGGIKTRMTEGIWTNPQALKEWNAGIPLGRMGEPEDISQMALFLASEASSFITGQTFIVDGGKIILG